MSASREKRQRKLQDAAAEELNAKKKKDDKDNGSRYKLATVVVIIALVLSVALFVYQGFVAPNSAAVTIGGEKVYDHELSYYYINSYSNFVNQVGDYASSLFGLDTSKPLSSQPYYAGDGTTTWHDYFLESAKSTAQQVHMLAAAAEKDGMVLSEENEQHVQDEMKALHDFADTNGYDVDAYLSSMYGKRMNEAEYEKLVRRGYVASQYSEEKYGSFENAVTDADIDAYYADNRNSFDLVTYRRYLVTADTNDDMTEEQRTAALDTARSTAERIAAASTNEAEFIAQIVTYQNEVNQRVAANSEPDEDGNLPEVVEYTSEQAETDTLRSSQTYSQTESSQAEWLFSGDVATGDTTTIDASNGTYVLLFLDRTRNNYNTIDVRHILVSFDDYNSDGTPVSENGDTAEDADTADTAEDTGTTDEQKDAATAEAERILDEWKNGAATEDSFAELAKQYSDDGNAEDGGIYERVYKGQMVSEFEDWCFDSSRKPGDTGVVETAYGEHVMYFVGTDLPYWQIQVRTAKANADYSAWQTAELENYKVVEKGGISNVGLN